MAEGKAQMTMETQHYPRDLALSLSFKMIRDIAVESFLLWSSCLQVVHTECVLLSSCSHDASRELSAFRLIPQSEYH